MYKFIVIVLCLLSISGFAQVNESWNVRFSGSANGIDQAVDMVIDASGNAYVTGITNNGSDFDVITIKYNASGVQQWSNTYGGTGLDEPKSMTIDNSGNIIVVGSKFISGSDWDIFTLKIDGTTGAQSWVQTYAGSALFDLGNDVAIDAANNVYVAGTYYQSSSNLDYVLLKYNTSGSFQWDNVGGSTVRTDEGLLVEIDNSGNAILGGTAEFTTNTTYFDFRIMKINSLGVTVWTLTEDSGFGKLDKPRAMIVNPLGDIFIGGGGFSNVVNLEDMLLMKISNSGVLQWKDLHSGNGQANDFISALTIDPNAGTIFATGRVKSNSSAEDFHTRAYSITGAEVWASTFSSSGNNFDAATDITFKSNFVYVTGYTFKAGQASNYTTIKYDLTGAEKWRTSFNYTSNQNDRAYKVSVDNQENVYITGASYGGSTSNTDIATIKYCQLETIASPDTAICIGNSVSLAASATGGFNYIWSVISGTAISPTTLSCTNCQSPTASPDTTTIYAVRSENAIGCVDFDTVTIVVNKAEAPIITATPSLSYCIGDSTTLSVNNQTYASFVWNSGGFSSSTTVNTAAQHIVTVTDVNGCTNKDTVHTIHHNTPSVDAGADQTICAGQSAQLQASGASTYLWNANNALSQYIISNPLANPNNSESFFVTGTDNNGCTASDTINITVNSLPVVTASGGGTICLGDTLPLLASGAINYSWDNPSFLDNSNTSSPDAFPTQSTTFIVTGTDANNCQAQASTLITVNPLPFINAGVDQTLCLGNSVNLSATGGSNYQWNSSPTLSDISIPNPIASPVTNTEYIVQGTNANGCSNTDTVFVTVSSLPNVDAGLDTVVCLFESIELNASGAISYQWNASPSLTGNNLSNPIVQPITPTTYTVTGTGINGCSATDNVLVTINSLPNIDAGNDLFVCQGDSTQLNVTGGITYIWNFDVTLSDLNISNPFAKPVATSTYSVTGTDANGCKNTDNVIVSINPLPLIFAGNDFSVCENETAQLQASGGLNYVWDSSTSLSITNIFDPLTNPMQASEWFYVTGSDNNNCENRDSILVSVNPLPLAPILTDTFPNIISSYVFGNNWYFNGTLDASLNNDSIDYVNIGNLGIYSATHTDFNGCTSEFSNEIEINKLIYDVSVPEHSYSFVNFNVYPNPVKNSNLNIELFEGADRITITDLSGQLIYQVSKINQGIHQINMENFESGLYIVTVQANYSSKSLKVIKH
ncbi:MAG: T9SS type A sorting domain-containing protein [Crocinitomicaceae bacterium]